MPKVVTMKNLRDLGHVCMTFSVCFGEWNTNLKYVHVSQKHPVYAADLITDERKKHGKAASVV